MRVPTTDRSFVYLCAAFVALLLLALTPSLASAHHEVQPKRFTQAQAVKLYYPFRDAIKRKGYPVEFHLSAEANGSARRSRSVGRDELRYGRASDGKVIWNRIRNQVADWNMKLHPRSDAFLYWYASRPGTSIQEAWWATWEADNLVQWKRDYLNSIPCSEGGYGPVVGHNWDGGAPEIVIEEDPSTWPGAETGIRNTVGGWWQDRPGWVNGWIGLRMAGRVGAHYGVDSWNSEAIHWLFDPIQMARMNEYLTDQYDSSGC